jgi:large subunit ribosomal protein L32
MAVPKRKSSKTRGRKRRTHKKIARPGFSKCPSCGESKLPHRVCPHCGTYNGREIVVEEKKEKE